MKFLEQINELLMPDRFEDFVIFMLQQLITDTEESQVDCNGIYEVFCNVLSSAGFDSVPSKGKVRRLLDKLLRERQLFTITLNQEIEQSWYKK